MLNPVAPGFALEKSDEESILRLTGDWTVATLHTIEHEIAALTLAPGVRIDVSGLGRLDTAGAFLIDRLLRAAGSWPPRLIGEHPSATSLLEQVHAGPDPVAAVPAKSFGVIDLLERIGRGTVDLLSELVATLAFLGETVATILR
ncbi:MAG: STAS domain-containing protein, partial [Alphaproteobacteria bacterium]|nr:STAS domain-containing protein [Alphaproteobacteria bacterium]